MARKTFPEIKTKEFLEKENLKYLHHVYIEDTSNKFKRRSEIDFIVFHKRGILLLECKGGDRYERLVTDKSGKQIDTWKYFEGDTFIYKQDYSPYHQITENLEDFRRLLCQKDDKFKNICFAKGVIFPYLNFSDAGILENAKEITYDKNSKSFKEYIEGCFNAEYKKKDDNFYQEIDDGVFDAIKSFLFPEEPSVINSASQFREYSVKKIKKYLYGTHWLDKSEVKLASNPYELFSTGRLHPLKTPDEIDVIGEDTDEENQIEGESEWQDSEDSNIKGFSIKEENTISDFAVNSHSTSYPSSAGLYFSMPIGTSLSITYGYSIYKKDANGYFVRIPEIINIKSKLDQKKSSSYVLDKNEFVSIEVRTIYKDDSLHVGIYIINRSENEHLFQVGLEILLEDNQLIEQDPIFDDSSDNSLFDDIKIYGSGKGAAVNWNDELNKIWIDFIPEYDVAKIESKSPDGVDLSMLFLADPDNKCSDKDYISNLNIFANSYKHHLDNLSNKSFSENQKANFKNAELFYKRIKKGIHFIELNQKAMTAFKLMNLSILTMFARKSNYNGEKFYTTNPEERKPSWYAFQLAFCLASIPGIIDPEEEKDDREIVDLIWFPTGGGKTESYLALLSFTIIYRRLLDPNNVGTTVIMRYTLRLLVQDQFSRLASLTVAMDYIRKIRFNNIDLGQEQITLGYWVGKKASPGSIKEVKAVVNEAVRLNKNQLPFVLDNCPWCHQDLVSLNGKHAYMDHILKTNNGKPECINKDCGYTNAEKSALPMLLWEEEIFKNPPTIIIGTVDNFAKLAWKRYSTENFFGSINENSNISPPDLIIQDELHLISGPLGSLVGLYDQLVVDLCSKKYPVKIAVSTATISNADKQISKLYGNRSFQIVPPPEIKWGESFFMSTNKDKNLSRKYLGIFNSSLSPVVGSINTASALLQSSSHRSDITHIDDKYIDPYKTLVWYFNSIRELAYSISSRWAIESRVKYLFKGIDSSFGSLHSRKFNYANLQELTSRKTADAIKNIKENLTTPFKSNYQEGEKRSVDILFATNMISVGVDIERLGLMMVNGLPKTTSEYIQASSRVGRKHPGLVITSYNINKSRDRSHYEYFKSMHEGLYRYVEPTSVTPFSAGARKKGLAGIFFAYIIHHYLIDDPSNISDDALQEAKAWIIKNYKLSNTNLDENDLKIEIDGIINRYLDQQENISEWGKIGGNADRTITSLMGIFSDSNTSKKNHVFDVLTSLRNVDRDVTIKIKEYE